MCVCMCICVCTCIYMCVHMNVCVSFQCPAELLMVTTLPGSALRAGTEPPGLGTKGTGVIPIGTNWKDIVFVPRCRLQVASGFLFFSSHTGLGAESEWEPDSFVLQGLAAAHRLLPKLEDPWHSIYSHSAHSPLYFLMFISTGFMLD